MSSLLIELEPNEKLFLELVDNLNIQNLIKEIKKYIFGLHIYIQETYYFMNINEEKDTNFKGINLPKGTKIIFENRNKKSKFIIHINAIVKDVDTIEDKKNIEHNSKEIINWNAKEIKTINIPYENESILMKNFENVMMYY